MSGFGRLFAFVARYPGTALLQLGLAVAGTLLVLVFPQMVQRFFDVILPQKRLDLILPAAALAVAAFAGRQALFALRTLVNNGFEQRVILDLRTLLYDKIQRLPLRWFDGQRSGDIMTRVAEDVPAMERVVIEGIEQGVTAVLQILVVAAVMLLVNPWLALIAMAPAPLIFWASAAYGRRMAPRADAARAAASDLNAALHDSIAGIRQIKAYTSEPEQARRFRRFGEALRARHMRMSRTAAIFAPTMNGIAEIGMVVTLAFGTAWAIEGRLTAGEALQFVFLLALFYEPVARLNGLLGMAVNGLAAARRVFAIFDQMEEPQLTAGKRLPAVAGHVAFESVSFSYSERAPTVTDISFTVAPGETLALVGPTGAGKSTILNLLARFYEAEGGRILLDGVPISGLSKEFLRDSLGFVTQEPFLFHGTVRENLLLARADADEAALWAALEAAHAAAFVRALPDGLDAWIGERGATLSGGERQRLSIARAILKNPPILLLDEATASLDNATERAIQAALDELRANRTCLVIAHRLSTVRHADRIAVLERGRIVETGRHEDLLARGGLYARLYAAGLAEDAVSSA